MLGRSSALFTCTADRAPPRAAGIPRWFSPAAISRRDDAPEARTSVMIEDVEAVVDERPRIRPVRRAQTRGPLNVLPRDVRRLRDRHGLPTLKIGRSLCVHIDALVAWRARWRAEDLFGFGRRSDPAPISLMPDSTGP